MAGLFASGLIRKTIHPGKVWKAFTVCYFKLLKISSSAIPAVSLHLFSPYLRHFFQFGHFFRRQTSRYRTWIFFQDCRMRFVSEQIRRLGWHQNQTTFDGVASALKRSDTLSMFLSCSIIHLNSWRKFSLVRHHFSQPCLAFCILPPH